VRIQHIADVRPREVGVSNDPRDHGVAFALPAVGRDRGDEFGLADGFQMIGARLPIARPTLDEDGLLDVVARAGVGPEVR
jgi:hypothetical protein